MNWEKYDAWKLASPEENDHGIEIFETEKFNYVSNDEDNINDFDHKMNLAIKDDCMYLHICDNLEEYAEHLADELNLYKDEYELISILEQDYKDEKEYWEDRKSEEKREETLINKNKG